ncbi:MAG: aminotransferase class I/II-fold pyridoxal phosphate-dependent enzyme [Phycisphaerae bacterium]|nr:aminotransferase class I/II-fold pyridoxal phosphate-dependent enzyme [Phycisphaerae bacterium]
MSIPGIIDLRSDTVTRPSAAMKRAMMEAALGDDVLGDDPTVIALQERVASLLGKEAACFVPSGTMANQAAIRALTEPGDEIICHRDSHIIHYETGAPAVISGCMIAAADGPRGRFTLDEFDRLVRPDNIHAPRTRLLVIENTHNRGGGSVWPIDRIASLTARARELGMKCHLDGARLWNASVASGVAMIEYARHFDTVATCFSKGLGAPACSAVSGDRSTIARVARIRKMLGGAMRQSGLLAAAALYAIEHNIGRLADDHANAKRLASGFARVSGLRVDASEVETNIVYVDIDPSLGLAADFCKRMHSRGVWMLPTAPQRFRAVTHMDVSAEQIDRAIERCAAASV